MAKEKQENELEISNESDKKIDLKVEQKEEETMTSVKTKRLSTKLPI